MPSNRILITGATGGLGKYLVSHFIKQNHKLIITSKSVNSLIELRNKFSNDNNDIQHYKCDLSDLSEVMALSDYCINNNVNVLINNAGIICPSKSLIKYSIDEIKLMLAVNLNAPIILTRLLASYLTDIININSIVGMEHKISRSIYSASKWGLRGFSESFKKEVPDLNILDVYPSNIRTWPGRENAMDVEKVVSDIYNSYIKKDSTLILDGRAKK